MPPAHLRSHLAVRPLQLLDKLGRQLTPGDSFYVGPVKLVAEVVEKKLAVSQVQLLVARARSDAIQPLEE